MSEHNERGQPLGFALIAKRSCGRISALAWMDTMTEDEAVSKAREWIARGDIVEKVERFAGDPMADWVCRNAGPCACREPRRAAAEDMKIETVQAVKILPTRVWAEKDDWGTVHIKAQHEGDAEPFDFIQIQYDYRYTSNGHQHEVTQRVLAMLGAPPQEPTP